MSTLNTYTVQAIDAAQQELKAFVLCMSNECLASGWTFNATASAPESFKALKATTEGKHVQIANYACNDSVYGCSDTNILFRFWHDVKHLELDSGFSLEGETKVIAHQLEQAKNYGLSELATLLFYCDTQGQVLYYFKHKAFVNNQFQFIMDCLNNGFENTLAIKQ